MPGSCPLTSFALLTRGLALLLSLSLALVRCGSGSPSGPDGQSEHLIEADAGCAHGFVVDEALRVLAEQSAERWSAATDCDVSVGAEGNTTVRLVDSVPMGEGGKEVPGWTSEDRSLVLIHSSLNPVRRYRTISHELGHALGGLHTDTDGVLSGRRGRRDVIDGAALETVCSKLRCGSLAPEGD